MDLEKLKENCLEVCKEPPVCVCCYYYTLEDVCAKTQERIRCIDSICDKFYTDNKTCIG